MKQSKQSSRPCLTDPVRGRVAQSDAPLIARQRSRIEASFGPALQLRPSSGGLPPGLLQGVAALSGHDLSGVRVHRNSDLPAQIGALAFAAGDQIHTGPGQEHHLPHEAWHVVQQAQGRVSPTQRAGDALINDDPGLEAEADLMGARAASAGMSGLASAPARLAVGSQGLVQSAPLQLMRPDTIYGPAQGNHTTAYAVVWRFFRQVYDAALAAGATMREAYEIARDRAAALGGAEQLDDLPDDMQARYRAAERQVDDHVANMPDHRHVTRAARAQEAEGFRRLELLENSNPLATTLLGDTGGGEGHHIRNLNTAEAQLQAGAAGPGVIAQAWRAVSGLFDARHTQDAIELEVEAGEDDTRQFLPGVVRGADGTVDQDGTRAALGDRHAGLIAGVWSRVTALIGGEDEISQRVQEDMLNGSDDEYEDE